MSRQCLLACTLLLSGAFRSAHPHSAAASTVDVTADGLVNGTVCNAQTFQEGYDFENAQGLFQYQSACEDAIRSAGAMRFGPPTAWQIFNVMCRGSCRNYMDRYARLQLYQNLTGCTCKGTQARCPEPSTHFLCSALGYCYDADYYNQTTCAIGACGRWASNAADYRGARKACNLDFDGALPHSLHWAIAVAAMIGAMALL